MIERKIFISNLFRAKGILNEFNEVEFESFNLFLKAYQIDLFSLSKEQILLVPIREIKEFDTFVDMATQQYFTDKCNIVFDVEPDLLKDVFERCEPLKNKRFSIITSSDCSYARDDFANIEGHKGWTNNNPLYIKLKITYDNIDEIVSRLVHMYIKQGWRFFKLSFDYESFNKATLDDIHKIEFWLYEIMNWVMGSNNDKEDNKIRDKQQPIIFYDKGFKTIFLSNDYKMYLNRQAFDEGEMLFDLDKHMNHYGEQVPYQELNKLRSYIDLKADMYGFKKTNKKYIDFYQNLKIMGHIIEIPIIAIIVGSVLNG